jgi:ABC-type bacteriocin/lantibiotic exporter with double-glycine peptidase domain
MVFMRPSPPSVTQANQWWCWAACLEILNRAHPNKFPSPPLTQEQWRNELRALPNADEFLSPQDGLNVHRLPLILNILGMTGHQWQGPPNHRPDISYIENKLHFSYVMAIHTVPGGSHFVIITGVDQSRVFYFDPYNHIGNTSVPHDEIRQARLIIAWKQ